MPSLTDFCAKPLSAQSRNLHAACVMWCFAKGLEPIPVTGEMEHALMVQAIADYGYGKFETLLPHQRQVIAGVKL